MREQLEQRLQELKAEFRAGEKLLAELDAKQMNLRSSMLRISGAIQVLEELLNAAQESNQESVDSANLEMELAAAR